MTGQRSIHNLALIGFMGTGKSCVGRMVASHLRFEFVDTDELIEKRAGRSITEIFARDGEAAFRQVESRLVVEMQEWRRKVISTGGGLAVIDGNLESLKQHALVVCLWATPEAIWQRVRNQTHRPLLQGPDPQGRIGALLDERTPFYRQADVLVNTGMRSIREVTQQVLHQFHLARSRPATGERPH
jgi:shikimate kinase